jgi:hypothetical protein
MLKILLRTKMVEKDLRFSEKYINLIIDFYLHGVSKETYDIHIGDYEINARRDYFRSRATIDNAKSFLKKKGIITNGKISTSILPTISREEDWVLRLQVQADDN